ncbi:MAG: hypothetical protein WC222_05425 [Parachlamydiales bacterium]
MVTSVNINGTLVCWRQADPQQPLFQSSKENIGVSSQWVSAQTFLNDIYTRSTFSVQGPYCTGKEVCEKTNVASYLLDVADSDEDIYQNFTETKKVWNAVRDIVKTSSNNQVELIEDPKEAEISAKFVDHVFRPFIPNSPLLTWSHNPKASTFKRSIGLFGLFFELPVRLLVVLGGHALLSGYSLISKDEKTADYIAYYRFRLDINAYSPSQEICKRIYNAINF